MENVKLDYISVTDYLAGEQETDIRHEYIDGKVYAMGGASAGHNTISFNIARRFGNHLQGNPCQVFIADMKVKVADNYYYPDVLVDCSSFAPNDQFSESPVLIIEVLSNSTRRHDLVHKLHAYQSLASLQEYIVVEQDFMQIDVFRRSEDWRPLRFGEGDTVSIQSIDFQLAVSEVYERIVFAEAPQNPFKDIAKRIT